MEKSMKVKIGIGAAVAVVAVLLVLSGMDKGQKKTMGADQEDYSTSVKGQN